ncbi:MAG: AraC family transcriptional regulator [Chitinophagaceae bacterium]
MQEMNDILSIAVRQPVMIGDLELLHQQEKQIPGSVQYSIHRYRMPSRFTVEDVGMLAYQYHPRQSKERTIELRFCISGNRYCNAAECRGSFCSHQSAECNNRLPSLDVIIFRYPSAYLSQFVKGKTVRTKSDELLSFRNKSSFTTTVQLCNRTRSVLENLLQHNYSDALENIYVNSQLQALLLYGLECLVEEKAEESFTCKFLANEADREKFIQAKEILLQRIGEPITIKELSRKVGTNECYLKKGFKELFGTTIFDFYQGQRMEHAKYLLYEKGLSVTDVSAMLGYSSISHFSTAFKKHTGLKPCELLFKS